MLASTTTRQVHAGPTPSTADISTAGQLAMYLDWLTPMTAPPGAGLLEPVTFSSPGGRDLGLFLHRRLDRTERRPGIVFVHGGGWAAAGPGLHIAHAHRFAGLGFVTANVHYRLSGEAPWPACIEDVQAAIRWLRANAAEVGCDPDRIVVMGGSAGGHLAAMAALLGVSDPEAAAQAAVLWYPAADLRAFTGEAKAMIDQLLPGADEEAVLAASPIAVVSPDAPPVLTMTGDIDPVTRLDDIQVLHDRLSAAGVRNELDVFEGRDHGFDYHPADFATCMARVDEFLLDVIGAP